MENDVPQPSSIEQNLTWERLFYILYRGSVAETQFTNFEFDLQKTNDPSLLDWYINEFHNNNSNEVHKFSFDVKWIKNSILFNKNLDYDTLKISFENSIFNSQIYNHLFDFEIKSIKTSGNNEIYNLFIDYHKKFIDKNKEMLIKMKTYGFSYYYFSPLTRYLAIYVLLHSLFTENKQDFFKLLDFSNENVNCTKISNKIRYLEILFIENFIKCLFLEEGYNTKILSDLDQIFDSIEVELKFLDIDFLNKFNLIEFINYTSPSNTLSELDIKIVNEYILKSITDIRIVLKNAIKVVNLQDSNHIFNKYLNLYEINKNNNDIANNTITLTKQKLEKENIKKQLEELNSNQIARLLINLIYDLDDKNYIFKIKRTYYCKNILQYFYVKEELINQTINAIGKSTNKADLKDLTKSTYKIICNYLEKNSINIMNFCE